MVEPITGTEVNLTPIALRNSFRQIRQHSSTTFGTAAVLCVPLAFVGVYRALAPGWVASGVGSVATGLIGVMVAYSATVVTAIYAEGKDPGVAGLLGRTFSRGLWRFLLTSVLVVLVIGVAVALALIPMVTSVASLGISAFTTGHVSDGAWLSLGLGAMFSVPLIAILIPWLFLKFALARPAAALGGTGPMASLGQSWNLTRGRLWDLFLLLVTGFVLYLVIGGIVTGPAGLVTAGTTPAVGADPFSPQSLQRMLGPGEPQSPAGAVVVGVSGYLAAVLLTPLWAILLAEFYLLARTPPAAKAAERRLVPLRDTPDGFPRTPPQQPAPRPDRMVPLRQPVQTTAPASDGAPAPGAGTSQDPVAEHPAASGETDAPAGPPAPAPGESGPAEGPERPA